MRWIQDALQIFFAHMKNDQTGSRPRDPRHVYSNPYNPYIDPILTLISYLIVTPPLLILPQLFFLEMINTIGTLNIYTSY